MGQTLTHGVYLPSEGERNCYSGLASNWRLLNGAIGTVAAHTTAIAEKAPLVHTHTVSQITDFPAYGNAAGTICEGNDSRLSDARTPVAHTHTKSDVTDLLKSNFIPSANNSYDLGSSSYQWNSLYAKNYYYNGTAWGLDKYNQWTGVNDFNNLIGLNGAELWFKNSNIDDITANPSADTGKSIVQIWNKGTTQYCGGIIDGLDTSGTHVFEIVNFGYPLNSTNAYQHRFRFASKRDGTASFYPTYPNVDLGTSTGKWKSFNGINPGALSLPNVNAVTGSSNTQLQDISGDLVQDQYFNCYFTPRMDGWVYIALDCSNATIRSGHSSYTVSVKTARGFADSIYTQSFTKNENAFSNVQIFIPVTANKEITLECSFTGFSVTKGYVIPCLGNV